MTDLTPITAFGAPGPRSAVHALVTLTENTALTLASLAVGRGVDAPVVAGLTLPEPGKLAAGTGVTAFWTGPNQWMIETSRRAGPGFAADLAISAPGCAVTDQTDGWVVIDVTSSAGAAPIDRLMRSLVNIDPLRFGPGAATRTLLHHLSVFVIRRSQDTLTVLAMRSAAGSLWHAVDQAARRQSM